MIELTICSRCGTVADGPATSLPLGWSTSTMEDRIDALCDRCTRDHVRDIESKLDEVWWEAPG